MLPQCWLGEVLLSLESYVITVSKVNVIAGAASLVGPILFVRENSQDKNFFGPQF